MNDRQDGDGLLTCPLCQSSNIVAGICFVEDSIKHEPAVRCGDCGCRATLKAWNTRPPTRDGAEGVGKQEEWAFCLPWSYDPGQGGSADEPEMPPHVGDADGLVLFDFVKREVRDDTEGELWWVNWHIQFPRLVEAVNTLGGRPALDGANRTLLLEMREIVVAHVQWDREATLARIDDALSPSPAIAAEPETEQQLEDRLFKQEAADMLRLIDYIADKIGLPNGEELSRDNFNAWLAALPVRGHREEIRLLIVEACDLLAERSHGNPARSAGHNARLALEAALRLLPVQPGAGEREAELCELLRQFIMEFWIDKPQMMWKRTLCDDGVEMVHHDGDTIFFGDANHKEPSDTARFDLIVELANAAPRLLRALCQAPHSSREGGR